MKYSDMLAAQLKLALEKEQAIEEKYGVDQTDGSVITFKVKFNMGDVRTYKYAALRIKVCGILLVVWLMVLLGIIFVLGLKLSTR